MRADESSKQQGGGRLRVTWNSKTDCTGQSQTSSNHADIGQQRGWQSLSIAGLTAPDEAVAVRVELIQYVSDVGSYVVHWDDIQLSVE